jgi:ABC-type transporter Mla subunit MlaD
MMARPKYEKLGLLALLVVVAIIAFGFLLGIRTEPSDTYHTYFDESVQGLETGAFVKYRGVRIGSVGAITVAPDGRYIDVALEIDRARARELAIGETKSQLRARLAIIGITGLKLVDIEPAGKHTPAPPELGFSPPEHYIPSRQSLFASIENAVERAGPKLALVVDQVIATLDSIELLARDAQRSDLATRVATAADRVAAVAAELRHTVRRLDGPAVRAAQKLDTLLDGVDGPDGLVAGARRAADSFGEVGRMTQTSAAGLERTLRELRDAARAIRAFFDDLARQPDMIVKGRASARSR